MKNHFPTVRYPASIRDQEQILKGSERVAEQVIPRKRRSAHFLERLVGKGKELLEKGPQRAAILSKEPIVINEIGMNSRFKPCCSICFEGAGEIRYSPSHGSAVAAFY